MICLHNISDCGMCKTLFINRVPYYFVLMSRTLCLGWHRNGQISFLKKNEFVLNNGVVYFPDVKDTIANFYEFLKRNTVFYLTVLGVPNL
ncbi:hypothetical protein GDO86_006512 [Hymenochirus boettgeri]|uniref:Uncharacterized protein n=1 Tax=Hymenochirus boettgeri TaxID=247094 RepID=A0A8T2JDZ3_9PIPI|nr:hypothetical protein GDO86_006512 [Hymenochirus boettgeri]